jgi:serine/threonine protein kinase
VYQESTIKGFEHLNQVVGTPGFIDPYILKNLVREIPSQGFRESQKNESGILNVSSLNGQKLTEVLDASNIIKGDIFALGCTFFQLVTGKAYIEGTSNDELIQNSKKYVMNESRLR